MRMITIPHIEARLELASISRRTLPQENAYNFSNVIIIFLLNSKLSKQCTPQRFLSLSILKQSQSLSCVAVASWLLHILHVSYNKTLSCLLSFKNHHFHLLITIIIIYELELLSNLFYTSISQGSLQALNQVPHTPLHIDLEDMKDLGQVLNCWDWWEAGCENSFDFSLIKHQTDYCPLAELLSRISGYQQEMHRDHRGQRSSTRQVQEALKFKIGASQEFWSELSCKQEISAPRMLAVLNSLIRTLSFPSLAACEPLRHFRIILEINVLTVARPEITNHNIDYNYQYFPCRGVFCLHNRLWSSPARPVIIV